MQPMAQAVGKVTKHGISPIGATENRDNSLTQLSTVQECRDPSLRLVFALSAQRPILAQDDNYKR
jgi:hypothetical protein